jgi:hypothetical protein
VTAALEIGTERVVRKVLLPQAWDQKVNRAGGMRIDTWEHIDEIDVGSDTLQATRRQYTVDHSPLPGTDFRPTDQPVFAPERHGPNLPFPMSGIKGHVGIG